MTTRTRTRHCPLCQPRPHGHAPAMRDAIRLALDTYVGTHPPRTHREYMEHARLAVDLTRQLFEFELSELVRPD